MSEDMEAPQIMVPLSVVVPVRLASQATEDKCGLFFPYRNNLPMGLVVDWEKETHLIHLDGPHIFKESRLGIGSHMQGVLIKEFEYRVDVTSRYNSVQDFDPAGALVLKGGDLYLMCDRLGGHLPDDTYGVPIAKGFQKGGVEEACGFTRWNIALREGHEVKVVRSFEARPKED